MDESPVDLEGLTEAAWREFRAALADAMELLGAEDDLRVALDAGDELDGAPPYVRALREEDAIVLEVASNRCLSTGHRLTRQARRDLRCLGLAKPSESGSHYRAGYARTHVDQAASVAVSALREAFGVVHPAFLVSDDLTWSTRPSRPSAEVRPEGPVAVYPTGHEHLDALVEQALASMFGQVPQRDSDGDFPIREGSAVVFVRTQEGKPVVRLFAEMVVEVGDTEAAVHEVGVLNGEIGGVKFTFQGDQIVASVDLLALPFVAEHLRLLVTRLCDVVSSTDHALARRVSGRVFLADAVEPGGADEEEPEADDISPVMMRLLQLDALKPGSLRPKHVAKLCGNDSDTILDLIRWNEEQEIEWRRARDEAIAADEPDEAAACEHERAHARRTVKILRKALRRVLIG